MSGGESLDLDKIFPGADPMAQDIANVYLEWNAARVNAKDRWKETTEYLYATSTRETQNATTGGFEEDSAGWSHSTHVPKLTQIADNLSANYMSAIYPHDSFFQYIGEDFDAVKQDTRNRVESYIKSKHRNNGFRNVLQRLVDDYILYGNCFAMVHYEDSTKDTDEGPVNSGYTGPKVTRISPYDIVFNPLATSFEQAPKILRSLKSMGEIARDIEDRPELGYEADIFEKMSIARHNMTTVNVEDFDKHSQLQFDGFSSPSQYFKSGMVEVMEFYGDMYDLVNKKFLKNHVITIVDRTWVIRTQPLETWTGRPHIYHAGWRSRPDNLWAMGPLDNLIGMQYLVNHLENARADAFDQMLAPTRVIVGDVEQNGVEAGVPGGEYLIPSGEGSVNNLLPDTTVLTADIQIDRKFAQMEEFAGSPKQEAGIRTPGEKTATEVDLLSRAASRIFQARITQLEEFIEKLLNAELELGKRFLNTRDVVAVLGEDGVRDFVDITRDDLTSNGNLVPVGARHFTRRQQLATNFQLMQQVILSDPMMINHFSSVKMARVLEELMDMDNVEVVTPYVRVSEQADLMKLNNAAMTQIEVEDNVDLGGVDDETVSPPDAQLPQ